MYLSEHQAKEILAQFGVRVPEGAVAESPEEAESRARGLRCEKFAVKAQILAGGRGLAGGVKFAATPSGVRDAARDLIGTRLVTDQTGPDGEKVRRVYVEAAVDIRQSVYLALVIDERSAAPLLLGSREGGVEFERKAESDPSILAALPLPREGGLDGVDLAGFLAGIGIEGAGADSTQELLRAAARAAFANDAILLEINPLSILPDGTAVAVDAKMVIDDSALYRHPEFESIVRDSYRDEYERVARENEINFVKLQGEIGLVVNGAGLGLATNDMVADAGGRPANFMDIRTTATSFQIAKGVQLLLDDPSVKVLLVNVHGGGMTVCDTVAEGINFAYSRSPRKPPIVFRAAGQNAGYALTIMKDRRLPFVAVDDISTAVARAVALARGEAA
jgi:succinyl-CoA synthetase beta subunit